MFLSVDIGFWISCCLLSLLALYFCVKERFELIHAADEVIRVLFFLCTLFQLIFARACCADAVLRDEYWRFQFFGCGNGITSIKSL